jgi:RNA polymerase sigma-70 factor, ECF subfamily
MFSRDRKIERLVRQIQAGDRREESAEELFRQLYGPVERVFQRHGFSAAERADLTQDVLLRVYEGIDGFAGRSSFASWLQTIVLNVYRNEIRRRRAGKRDAVEKSTDDQDDPPEIEAVDQNPLAGLIDEERYRMLRTAVEEMPAQMQTCFRLRYDHEYKYREIADVMRISIQTVKAHLHQARKWLVEHLALDLGEEPEE